MCWLFLLHHSTNTKPVDIMLQIQVPLSCLPKYSDNDVPGSTSILQDSTVPEAAKCYHEMQFYEDGAQWTSKHDSCTMCNCNQNLVKCDTVPCPQLTCVSKTTPGECCPTCTSELTFNLKVIWRNSIIMCVTWSRYQILFIFLSSVIFIQTVVVPLYPQIKYPWFTVAWKKIGKSKK
jgi:hypothetical protein